MTASDPRAGQTGNSRGPRPGNPKIFVWVQHLLGIGHLRRVATLARGFRRAGMEVAIVSGGMPVPGLDFAGARLIQLPPLRAADETFRELVDEAGVPADEAFHDRRREMLLAAFRAEAPDVVVTELFPFGRRQLRRELVPLLDAARARTPRPLIVSSVRDILVAPSRPERAVEMLDRIEASYDRVMVHGDPTLVSFADTFVHADRIADRIAYTGYAVDPAPPRDGGPGTGEVLVSAGGGAVSEALFRTAMAARPRTRLADRTWRLLAGHGLPAPVFADLARAAPAGVTVERARPDFTALLANCALSISQGGYNTVLEMIVAGTRGVIVPFAAGAQTEQTLRARLLATRSGIRSLAEADLDPARLAEAVDSALAAPPPDATGLDTGGADASARLIRDWLAA